MVVHISEWIFDSGYVLRKGAGEGERAHLARVLLCLLRAFPLSICKRGCEFVFRSESK